MIEAEWRRRGGPGLVGIIVSLGGQTPLKLAAGSGRTLVLGTPPDAIDLAEDRERWSALCARLEIPQPPGGTASTVDEALAVAAGSGTRHSSGRATSSAAGPWRSSTTTRICRRAMAALAGFGSLGREGGVSAERPVLVDRFLEDAIEVDVDAVRDATGEVLVAGVMEHVEEAGVHSGDSACALPPRRSSRAWCG